VASQDILVAYLIDGILCTGEDVAEDDREAAGVDVAEDAREDPGEDTGEDTGEDPGEDAGVDRGEDIGESSLETKTEWSQGNLPLGTKVSNFVGP
jgi:hypothetical protein